MSSLAALLTYLASRLVRNRDSGDYEAVLSLAVSDQTLYAGMQDGGIKVFDLETKSVIRTIVGTQVRITRLCSASRGRSG